MRLVLRCMLMVGGVSRCRVLMIVSDRVGMASDSILFGQVVNQVRARDDHEGAQGDDRGERSEVLGVPEGLRLPHEAMGLHHQSRNNKKYPLQIGHKGNLCCS
jgi:hypothetical protein